MKIVAILFGAAVAILSCSVPVVRADTASPRSGVDAVVDEIDALREAGKFLEARDSVRRAVQQHAAAPDLKKLRDIEIAIRDQLRCYISMKGDIEQLSAQESATRAVAVEHLLCEEVGRIVLRQAVREGAVQAAVSAGRGLAEIKDVAGIQTVLARAKTEPDLAGATALFAILPDVSRFVPLSEVPAAASWSAGKPASARAPITELMKRRAVSAPEPAEIGNLVELALGPDTPARRGAAEFLSMVFRLNARRDPDSFNKTIGADKYPDLLGALDRDRLSGDQELSRWATQQWFSMVRIDKDAIAKDLHARWTLDTLGQGQFNDSGPSGRNLNAKNLPASAVVPGLLGKALVCTNENVTVEWGQRGYGDLQTNDFSVAAWIRVLSHGSPSGDPDSVILGSDVNGGRTSGLILGTNGVLGFFLPVLVQPPPQPDPKRPGQPKRPGRKVLEFVSASATQPLPTNRWYHVAASVSRATSEVTLYVNGEVAGRSGPRADAGPADVNGPLRIGSARSQVKERRTSCVFQGIVDDVRIYRRVIPANDVGMLFAQGEIEP